MHVTIVASADITLLQVVGRLAPQVAKLLMGKHKPTYMPHADNGDFVVVVNARQAAFTGKKSTDKLYRWHTGWMGGLKTLTARQMMEKDPRRILELAVKGMLPKNPLRDDRLKRLRVYPDEAHAHASQVAQSHAFAGTHMQQVAPYPVFPRPQAETGALVVDAERVATPDELAAVQWTTLGHDEETARKYQAFQAKTAAKRAKYQKALDAHILARARELDEAERAAVQAAKAGAGAPQMR